MRIGDIFERAGSKQVVLSSGRKVTVRFVPEATVTAIENQIDGPVALRPSDYRDAKFKRENLNATRRKAAAVIGVALGVTDAKGREWCDQWTKADINAFADEVRGAISDSDLQLLFGQVTDFDGTAHRLQAVGQLNRLRTDVLPRMLAGVADAGNEAPLAERVDGLRRALESHLEEIEAGLEAGEFEEAPGGGDDDALIGTGKQLGNSSAPSDEAGAVADGGCLSSTG